LLPKGMYSWRNTGLP